MPQGDRLVQTMHQPVFNGKQLFLCVSWVKLFVRVPTTPGTRPLSSTEPPTVVILHTQTDALHLACTPLVYSMDADCKTRFKVQCMLHQNH